MPFSSYGIVIIETRLMLCCMLCGVVILYRIAELVGFWPVDLNSFKLNLAWQSDSAKGYLVNVQSEI